MHTSVESEIKFYSKLPEEPRIYISTNLASAERYMLFNLDKKFQDLRHEHIFFLEGAEEKGLLLPDDALTYVVSRVLPFTAIGGEMMRDFERLPREVQKYLAENLGASERYFEGSIKESCINPLFPDREARLVEASEHEARLKKLCTNPADAVKYLRARLVL